MKGVNEASIDKFQEKIGIKFNDLRILDLALTHSSYANENNLHGYNERLEFLGDSVLQLCITEYLYQNCKYNNEGDLTRKRAAIVCEASLYKVGKQWELGSFIKLSRGESVGGGRKRISTVADAVEAVIAAIYLDKGYEIVSEFILRVFENIINNSEVINYLDHKTRLQEFIQSKTNDKIRYDVIKEEGPSHRKIFHVQVVIGDKKYSFGMGKSKKEAEQNAAEKTLKMFK